MRNRVAFSENLQAIGFSFVARACDSCGRPCTTHTEYRLPCYKRDSHSGSHGRWLLRRPVFRTPLLPHSDHPAASCGKPFRARLRIDRAIGVPMLVPLGNSGAVNAGVWRQGRLAPSNHAFFHRSSDSPALRRGTWMVVRRSAKTSCNVRPSVVDIASCDPGFARG